MTRRAAVGLAMSVGVLLSACGGENTAATTTTRWTETPTTAPPEDPTTSTTLETDPTIVQLCAVLNAASAGEIDVARSTFDHGPLHTLAATVTDIDRSVAARLLEAKEAVESDLAEPVPDGTALVTDLESLLSATADAIVATGAPRPATCDSENQ